MILRTFTWANTIRCDACQGTGSVERGCRGANDPDYYAEHCLTCDGLGEIAVVVEPSLLKGALLQ